MLVNTIVVKLQKTIQERQYEPIVFGLELSADVSDEESPKRCVAALFKDAEAMLHAEMDVYFTKKAGDK